MDCFKGDRGNLRVNLRWWWPLRFNTKGRKLEMGVAEGQTLENQHQVGRSVQMKGDSTVEFQRSHFEGGCFTCYLIYQSAWALDIWASHGVIINDVTGVVYILDTEQLSRANNHNTADSLTSASTKLIKDLLVWPI